MCRVSRFSRPRLSEKVFTFIRWEDVTGDGVREVVLVEVALERLEKLVRRKREAS